MPLLNDSGNILEELKKTSSEALSEGYAKSEGLTDIEREISRNDKEDDYAIRQRRKQILLQILGYLPKLA